MCLMYAPKVASRTIADIVRAGEVQVEVKVGKKTERRANPILVKLCQNSKNLVAFLAACDLDEDLRRAAEQQEINLDELRDYLSTGGSHVREIA